MSRCPVCGFGLDFAPWIGDSPADELCPSCGIQFGYDDSNQSTKAERYRGWRTKWIDGGMNWFSAGTKKPESWNPVEQLRHVQT
jgi:hypothetical protein